MRRSSRRCGAGTALEKARKPNNLRLIEVPERDERSLSRILDGVDAIDADHAAGVELDLRIARLREELALAHGRVRELEVDRRLRRT